MTTLGVVLDLVVGLHAEPVRDGSERGEQVNNGSVMDVRATGAARCSSGSSRREQFRAAETAAEAVADRQQ